MIRIAQVGVGYWGVNLLRNLFMNPRCEVITALDIAPERRQYVCNVYPTIKVESEFQTICSDPDVDAIVIATPAATHFDLARKALQAGKHILVEKPIAMSVSEVDEIGRISSDLGKVVMADHTFLFNAAVQYIKSMIQSKELGDLHYIYCERLNMGKVRSDIDSIWSLAPHDISILQYWLDDPNPITVIKHGIDILQPGINDVGFLNIIYPRKIMAHIHVSWIDSVKTRRIKLVGSKQMLIYDDLADNKVAVYKNGHEPDSLSMEKGVWGNGGSKALDRHPSSPVFPKIDFQEPLKMVIDHFLDCIENGRPCLTGVSHARRVVEILSC